MLVVQGVLNIVHSSVGHAAAFEYVEPFLCGLLLCDLLDHAINLRSVLHSGTICYKSIACLPLRMAQSITENSEESVISSAKEDIPIQGLVASIRDNRSCSRSVYKYFF